MAQYGAFLTEKQRNFARLHFVEMQSFAAIAREAGVTRQAVHDAVRIAQRELEGIAAKLSSQNNPPADPSKVKARIGALRRRVASQGIIYSPDWIVRELGEIEGLVG